MYRPISSLMDAEVVTVSTENSIEAVEQAMNSGETNIVTVLDDDGGIFGVITARDLVRFLAARKNPKTVCAWEICTHKLIEVGPHVSVLDVAHLMVDKKIHHILVTENGLLLGVVSSFNMVEKYLLGNEADEHEPTEGEAAPGNGKYAHSIASRGH